MNKFIIPGAIIGALGIAVAVSTGIAANLTAGGIAALAAVSHKSNDDRTVSNKPKSDK